MIQQTSRLAFKELRHQLGDRQRVVYDFLSREGSHTNSEIALGLRLPINTITPRVHELRKMGYVREKEKRYCQVTGRLAMEWEVAINNLF